MTPTDLEILIRAHQAQVMRYLRYLGATTEEQVEELTQQTFVAAFDARNVPPLDDDARRAAWLRGIAANRFRLFCRSRKRSRLEFGVQAMARAEAFWSRTFLRGADGFDYLSALRECVAQLDPRVRRALHMRYARNLSRAKTAAAMDLSEDGVKSLLRRTRALLKQCVHGKLRLEEQRAPAPGGGA